MKLVIIAWNGDLNETIYLVRPDKVDAFMDRFNYHGSWEVVPTTMTYFLDSL